jgi:hypothetical protein
LLMIVVTNSILSLSLSLSLSLCPWMFSKRWIVWNWFYVATASDEQTVWFSCISAIVHQD